MEGKAALVSHRKDVVLESFPYEVQCFQDLTSFLEALDDQIKLVAVDMTDSSPVDLEHVSAIRDSDFGEHLPVVIVHGPALAEQRLAAFKMGCDDFIDVEVGVDEIALRCEKLIYSKIANDQLQERVQQANQMAFIAMSDTSDLGVNIQYLIDVNQCDNLDELGMRLMQAISSYGIKGSLQMRGEFEIKNLDQSGMAKELESALLWELKDDGRYVDFGKRSVMNYEQVSLLVRNMPVDDEKKYGTIKDNVFSLLQGTDARVKALDNLMQLEQQQNLMKGLALRMKNMMAEIDDGYQDVMKNIADVVESMAEGTQQVIIDYALHEEQEKALETIMESGVTSTNQIFSDGLRLDESLKKIIGDMDDFFSEDSGPMTQEKRQKLLRLLQ